MMKLFSTIFTAAALIFAVGAQAQTHQPTLMDKLNAIGGALSGNSKFIESAQQKDFAAITHQQMGNAIAELAQELKNRNNTVMANELMNQWNTKQFDLFSNKDLGDHAPLFPWLEDFFQKLADQYGTIILSLPYVADLRTLNFAIPVVFSPRGSWHLQDGDNRIEYRKHFIPFANIVTYYAAKYGCLYIVQKNGLGDLKQLCDKAAEKLKFVMGRYLAPPISDFIYRQTTGEKLMLTSEQMVYETSEQLLKDIE